MMLSVFAGGIVAHFAWQQQIYDCENTGRFKTVDCVFSLPVREVVTETDASRWFAAEFGPEIPARWHHYVTRSVFRLHPRLAYALPANSIYEKFGERIEEAGVREKIKMYLFESDEKNRMLARRDLFWEG